MSSILHEIDYRCYRCLEGGGVHTCEGGSLEGGGVHTCEGDAWREGCSYL